MVQRASVFAAMAACYTIALLHPPSTATMFEFMAALGALWGAWYQLLVMPLLDAINCMVVDTYTIPIGPRGTWITRLVIDTYVIIFSALLGRALVRARRQYLACGAPRPNWFWTGVGVTLAVTHLSHTTTYVLMLLVTLGHVGVTGTLLVWSWRWALAVACGYELAIRAAGWQRDECWCRPRAAATYSQEVVGAADTVASRVRMRRRART